MDIKKARKILLQDSEFRKEYYKYDLAFEVSKMLIEARIFKNITQKKLAEMIDSKQSSIARAESGNYLPSLTFLKKIAEALHTHLLAPRFAFLVKHDIKLRHRNTNAINKDKNLYQAKKHHVATKLVTSSMEKNYNDTYFTLNN